MQNDKEEKKQEKGRKDNKEEINKKEDKQTGVGNHINGMATTAPISTPQIKTDDAVADETIPADAPPPTSLKKVSSTLAALFITLECVEL